MGTLLVLSIFSVVAVSSLELPVSPVTSAPPKVVKKHDQTCQEFSKGVTFKDAQAVGTWHLQHFHVDERKGHMSGHEGHCLTFALITDEERKGLSERIGKYVENLKWENLTLKMQIPCDGSPANSTRQQHSDYLEKLGDDGAYRTLQMPSPNAKLDLAEFHRFPMRLKVIEGHYLGMMDCHEKFVFLLGREPANGRLDERLKKMIESFWPDED